jgi:hypothetical protein
MASVQWPDARRVDGGKRQQDTKLDDKVKHADVVMPVRLGDNVDRSPKSLGNPTARTRQLSCISSVVGGRAARRRSLH